MNLFNARFDITEGGYVDSSTYKIAGTVVDNTGTYFGFDVQVGDIIYVDGSMIGVDLLRYKVKSINSVNLAEVDVNVSWDMIEGIDPQEPVSGMEAIIGAIHPNGLTANITPKDYNSANEVLISKATSYQTMLLGSSSENDSSTEIAEINTKVTELENKIDSVKLEWEDLYFNS